jgi:hypothetical protein
MPELSLLNVMNAPFPWHRRSSFQQLTELRVVHVQGNEWPFAHQLVAVLQSSPVLHTLTFVASGVQFDRAVQRFTLPSVKSLMLLYGSSTIVRLLSYADLPSLRQLTLSSFTFGSWDVALTSFSFLPVLTCLKVSSPFSVGRHVPHLLGQTRSLSCLDVRRNADAFARFLAGNPYICPLLKGVTFGDVSLELVCAFVVGRFATELASVIMMVQGYFPLTRADYLLTVFIRTLVPSFCVIVEKY